MSHGDELSAANLVAGQGEEYFKKADGKCNKLLFKDFEGAQEYFLKAGAAFKIEQNWRRAGDAFMRAGDCAIKQKSPAEACTAYTDSANCYKKVDLKLAGAAIDTAIQLNIENNRLSSAAKLKKDWAETLIADGHPEDAIPHFEKARDWYFAEEQPQSATSCIARLAQIHGELNHWPQALALYEELGKKYVGGPMKHQAKEFFLRALLCRLAVVSDDNRSEVCTEAEEAFEGYLVTDINFKNTREQEFCEKLLGSVTDNNVEDFDESVDMLNELRMLDDWKTHALFVIKKSFECLR